MAILVAQMLGLLWRLLSATAFTTPDVTTVPQVTALADTVQGVVNLTYGLAILIAGVLVMGHGTVQSRYGLGNCCPDW